MDELREKVAQIVYDDHGPLDGPNGCGWDSLPDHCQQQFRYTADCILDIPEIQEGLEMRSRFVDDPMWQKLVKRVEARFRDTPPEQT